MYYWVEQCFSVTLPFSLFLPAQAVTVSVEGFFFFFPQKAFRCCAACVQESVSGQRLFLQRQEFVSENSNVFFCCLKLLATPLYFCPLAHFFKWWFLSGSKWISFSWCLFYYWCTSITQNACCTCSPCTQTALYSGMQDIFAKTLSGRISL